MPMNNNLEEVYYSNKYERIDILLLKSYQQEEK